MVGRIVGNGIFGLAAELKRRSTDPWQHATFCCGFLLNVVFSGCAIWLELFAMWQNLPKHDIDSLQGALVTFFPAVTGVTFVQVLLEQRDDQRILVASILWFVLNLLAAGYLTFVPAGTAWSRVAVLSILCVAAMWFWVVANSDATMFQDPPDAATGGDPNAPLSGDLGDLEG